MHTALAMLKEAGVFGWIIAGTGALGALAALATGLAVALRARATMRLALVTTAIGAICAGLGGAGVLSGRVRTDRDIAYAYEDRDDMRPVVRQRLRREGYLGARHPGKLGLGLAALPLLAGVAAAFTAARRRAASELSAIDPEFPLPLRPRRGMPVAATLGALVSSGFALAALLEPVPGRNVVADQTSRRILDHVEDIQRVSDDAEVLLGACRGLEQAIYDNRETFDHALLPSLPAMAKRCVEARVQHAAVLSSLGAVRSELDDISRSPLVQHDRELARLVAATMEEVRQIEASPPPRDEPLLGLR